MGAQGGGRLLGRRSLPSAGPKARSAASGRKSRPPALRAPCPGLKLCLRPGRRAAALFGNFLRRQIISFTRYRIICGGVY